MYNIVSSIQNMWANAKNGLQPIGKPLGTYAVAENAQPKSINDTEQREQATQTEMDKIQQQQWQREDQIRQETQQREDTAFQRAVQDMRMAGVNPNLVGLTQSASGGGIIDTSSATASVYNAKINKDTQEKAQALEKYLKEQGYDNQTTNTVVGSLLKVLGYGAMQSGTSLK